mgnify:CR=1 FL=1
MKKLYNRKNKNNTIPLLNTKRLMLVVNAISPNHDEHAETIIANLSEATIMRIKMLSDLIEDNKLFKIEFLYNADAWYNDMYESDDIDTAIREDLNDMARVEGQSICVLENEFYFTCFPKNGGDDLMLESVRVPISALNDLNDLTLPLAEDYPAHLISKRVV